MPIIASSVFLLQKTTSLHFRLLNTFQMSAVTKGIKIQSVSLPLYHPKKNSKLTLGDLKIGFCLGCSEKFQIYSIDWEVAKTDQKKTKVDSLFFVAKKIMSSLVGRRLLLK